MFAYGQSPNERQRAIETYHKYQMCIHCIQQNFIATHTITAHINMNAGWCANSKVPICMCIVHVQASYIQNAICDIGWSVLSLSQETCYATYTHTQYTVLFSSSSASLPRSGCWSKRRARMEKHAAFVVKARKVIVLSHIHIDLINFVTFWPYKMTEQNAHVMYFYCLYGINTP